MSVIHIPRKHLRQPQGRMEINANNPLSNGVGGAWVFSAANGLRDCITGGLAINKGCDLLKTSPIGVGITPVTAGIQVPWDMGITTEDLAVTVVEWRTVFPDGYWMIADNRAAGSGYIYGSNAAFFTPIGTLTSPGYAVKTICKSEFWQEGIRTAAAIGTGLVPKKDIRFFGRYTDADAYRNTVVSALIVHRRNLVDGEAKEIYRNPWQLFRADPVRIYSLPSGPISLAINSITASLVTSSGARITLGMTR